MQFSIQSLSHSKDINLSVQKYFRDQRKERSEFYTHVFSGVG